MQKRTIFFAALALGLIFSSAKVGATSRGATHYGVSRRAAQEGNVVGGCQWIGADDGTCNSPDGCCTVPGSYLIREYPKSQGAMDAQMTDASPCTSAFTPTDVLSVKQSDLDSCNALAADSYCYVALDFESGNVTCKQSFSNLIGYTSAYGDPLKACAGSLLGNLVTCGYATRAQCTQGANADICTEPYAVFKKVLTDPKYRAASLGFLSDAQYKALQKLAPSMYKQGTCIERSLWLGGTNGNPDGNPNSAFGNTLSNLQTYLSFTLRGLAGQNDTEAISGKGCTSTAVVNRQAANAAQCAKHNLGATASGLPLANIIKCMGDRECELSYQLDAKGKPIGTPTCRASPARQAALAAGVISMVDEKSSLYGAYTSCYLYANRFNKASCEIQDPFPVYSQADFGNRRM